MELGETIKRRIAGGPAGGTRYASRLAAELDALVAREGADDYVASLLALADSAKAAGTTLGPGRGSAPCLALHFALGLSIPDPLFHDLPFELALSPLRAGLTDVGVEVSAVAAATIVDGWTAELRSVGLDPSEQTPTLAAMRVSFPREPERNSTNLPAVREWTIGAATVQIVERQAIGVISGALRAAGLGVGTWIARPETADALRRLARGELKDVLSAGGDTPELLGLLDAHDEEDVAVALALRSAPDALYEAWCQAGKDETELLHWPEPWRRHVAPTRGVMLFQEQFIRVAQDAAGFCPARADQLRREIGKKRPERLEALREAFLEGCVARGLPLRDARRVLGQLEAAYWRGPLQVRAHCLGRAKYLVESAWLAANHSRAYREAIDAAAGRTPATLDAELWGV